MLYLFRGSKNENDPILDGSNGSVDFGDIGIGFGDIDTGQLIIGGIVLAFAGLVLTVLYRMAKGRPLLGVAIIAVVAVLVILAVIGLEDVIKENLPDLPTRSPNP